jgi:DNA-binding transcriptional ArsR family regulator
MYIATKGYLSFILKLNILNVEQLLSNQLTIHELEVKKALTSLKTLNHKLRQQLLNFIHQKGTTTVSTIYKALKVEQSLASLQLNMLRKAGFLKRRREGKNMYYSVNYDKLNELQNSVNKL